MSVTGTSSSSSTDAWLVHPEPDAWAPPSASAADLETWGCASAASEEEGGASAGGKEEDGAVSGAVEETDGSGAGNEPGASAPAASCTSLEKKSGRGLVGKSS